MQSSIESVKASHLAPGAQDIQTRLERLESILASEARARRKVSARKGGRGMGLRCTQSDVELEFEKLVQELSGNAESGAVTCWGPGDGTAR